MPIELTHENMRAIARNVREVAGRDVKHTAIIDAIASALGKRGDALMHELKTPRQARPQTKADSSSPEGMALAAGLATIVASDGSTWFSARLIEARIDALASLDVFVQAAVDGKRTIDVRPEDEVWVAGVQYTALGRRRNETSSYRKTLEQAIKEAYGYAEDRHTLWNGFTEARIDHDLDETAPLMFSKMRNKLVRSKENAWEKFYHPLINFFKPSIARVNGVDCEFLQSKDQVLPTEFGDVRFRIRIASEGERGLLSDPEATVWFVEINFDDPDNVEGMTCARSRGNDLSLCLAYSGALDYDAPEIYKSHKRGVRS